MPSPLALAKQLINIPSITPEDNGCQDLIAGRLAKLGFDIHHIPAEQVSNLWALHGQKGPLFVFSGHTDVVPPGPLTQWSSDPFSATERDNTLYGRGAADMKSAVAAMTHAFERFLAQCPDPAFRLGMMLTSDEEGPATHGTVKLVDYLIEQQLQPDWCLIGEASSQHALADSIKIGRRGSLHGELSVLGKQGHIAYPQLADNPIHRCFTALDTLTKIQWDEGNEHFTPTSFQIYHIHADTGASNIIPGSLSAKFNFRYAPCSTHQELIDKVLHTLDEHQLDYHIDWNLSSEPFLSQPGTLTESIKGAISETLGIETEINTKGGTSDGRFIAKTGAEIVELGPINASIHQANEHINITDLNKLTDIYTQILFKLEQTALTISST